MTANILIDSLPTTVTVDGREYPIRSDFRIGILFEQLIKDKSIDNKSKLNMILDLYFDEKPQNVEEAFNQILEFYQCGKKPKKQATGNARAKKIQSDIYDFDYDDGYIYAAFLEQYGIDLNEVEYLHWWKFRALFRALKEDCEFVKIMGYRSVDLSKVKNKNERNRLARLKSIYALPSAMTTEEKYAAAGAIFGGS